MATDEIITRVGPDDVDEAISTSNLSARRSAVRRVSSWETVVVRRRHHHIVVVAAAAVLCAAAASCGDDASTTVSSVSSTSDVPSTSATSTTLVPPATTVPKSTASTTVAPATSAPTTAVTSTTTATSTTIVTETPDCSPDAFAGLASAVMGDAFGGVDVDRCQNGFARVFGMPIDPERFETEQFFVRWESGAWSVVDSGTGLSCGDPGNPPDLVAACEALGLSS